MSAHGIAFAAPAIDLPRLRAWKASVVKKLTGGLQVLARQRKVEVVTGVGRFVSPHVIEIKGAGAATRIRFEQCIIAAGSEASRLPGLPDDPRIMDSTGALELPDSTGRLLIIGGGIIGLEMACVYAALGSRVSVVELLPQLMPGCDADLVRPLEKRIRARYEQILTGTKVAARGGAAARPAGHVRRRAGTGAADLRSRAGRGGARAERRGDWRGCRRRQVSASAASFRSTASCAPMCRTSLPSAISRVRRCSRTRAATKARLPQK